jgi:AcrR family transcriptional regulator
MAAGRRAAHAADTRTAVLDAAEELFGNPGFAQTAIDEIASRAEVTKGAVYHHFSDKAQLFRAVVERLLRRLGERLSGVGPPPGGDVWDAVCAAYQARLDLVVANRAYQRIVDQDAAAVLGVRELEQLTAQIADTALLPVIESAVRGGVIHPVPSDRLARIMGALISAACREIAASRDLRATRVEVGETLAALLQGLRPK